MSADVIGYVLLDPNTNAMDWDGIVHESRTSAIKEAVGALHLDDSEKDRPCCTADLWYEVVEVRRISQDAVLEAAQVEWDKLNEYTHTGGFGG